jgi:hypothetical protein
MREFIGEVAEAFSWNNSPHRGHTIRLYYLSGEDIKFIDHYFPEGYTIDNVIDQLRIINKPSNNSSQAHSRAMAAAPKGGIDFTPASMTLQTKTNRGEIKFHMDPTMLKQLQNTPGFVPVIISIRPLKSLTSFLGLDSR